MRDMGTRRRHGIAAATAWLAVVLFLGGCAGTVPRETPDSVMQQGQQLFADGKYDAAVARFQRVLELDDTRWIASLYIARSYMAKGDWPLALSNARAAFAAAPAAPDARAALGESLLGSGRAALSTGQFADATALFSEYIALSPADRQGYAGAGQAYVGAGRYADALSAFVRGLQRDKSGPGRDELLKGLLDGGTKALQQGDPKSAVLLLQEYTQQDPGNAAGFVILGKALIEAGYRSDARGALSRALQLNPGQPEAGDLLRGLR